MSVRANLDHLAEDVQRLRVSWRKMNNYVASFATLWFERKEDFESGKYPGWTFAMWLGQRVGLPEASITKRLRAHRQALAEDHIEAAEVAIQALRQAERNRVEAEKAAKAKARQERQAAAAAKKAQIEAAKAAKAAAAKIVEKVAPSVANRHPASATPERGCERCGISLSGRTARARFCSDRCRKAIHKSGSKPTQANRDAQRNARDAKRDRLTAGRPSDAKCAGILDSILAYEQRFAETPVNVSRQIWLGGQYKQLRTLIQSKQVIGKDEHGHDWSWIHWVDVYVTNSPNPLLQQTLRTVRRWIEAYEIYEKESSIGTKFPYSPDDNVVILHANTL